MMLDLFKLEVLYNTRKGFFIPWEHQAENIIQHKEGGLKEGLDGLWCKFDIFILDVNNYYFVLLLFYFI